MTMTISYITNQVIPLADVLVNSHRYYQVLFRHCACYFFVYLDPAAIDTKKQSMTLL